MGRGTARRAVEGAAPEGRLAITRFKLEIAQIAVFGGPATQSVLRRAGRAGILAALRRAGRAGILLDKNRMSVYGILEYQDLGGRGR